MQLPIKACLYHLLLSIVLNGGLSSLAGVLCFDYCYRNNILITGGLDHNIRIWNPYMPKRAIAVLMGHLDAVTHVQMYRCV